MINAPRIRLAFVAVIAFAALVLQGARHAAAQNPGGTVSALGMYSLPQPAAPPATPLAIASRDTGQESSNGPLAQLVSNPYSADGSPPFALADQSGTIQRYVEPVPGIDLRPYVGQIVIVRHDTGRTLLATQLELPPQPLFPLLDDTLRPQSSPSLRAAFTGRNGSSRRGALVKPAQFVDDDDATVQLLTEGEQLTGGDRSALVNDSTESIEAGESVLSDNDLPIFPSQMRGGDEQAEEMVVETMPGAPMDGPGESYDVYPQDFDGMEPCPHCGGYHFSSECQPHFGHRHGPPFASTSSQPATLFGDVELNFIRAHLAETAAGKLSETYELAPRFILGFRNTGKADGRVRFWTYGRDTRELGGTAIRVDFDVLDVEGTHSFIGDHSELTVGAGFRLASIDLVDDDGDTAGSDLIGMTLSAEGRAPLFCTHGCRVSGVYGGRLSILGGDWGGDPGNDFIGGLVQDDNLVVHELQAGLDVATCCRHADVHARIGFEMQNWHSDALSQNAGTDSIGFIGPGLQLGAEF